MGTFIRYLIYIALVVIAFLIIQALWRDDENANDMVVEVEEVVPQPTIVGNSTSQSSSTTKP